MSAGMSAIIRISSQTWVDTKCLQLLAFASSMTIVLSTVNHDAIICVIKIQLIAGYRPLIACEISIQVKSNMLMTGYLWINLIKYKQRAPVYMFCSRERHCHVDKANWRGGPSGPNENILTTYGAS